MAAAAASSTRSAASLRTSRAGTSQRLRAHPLAAPAPRRAATLVVRAQFDGKTVVVTGASQGSGFEIAKAFADHGANVCMIARQEDRLREAASKIQDRARVHDARVLALPMDIGDNAQVEEMAKEVGEMFESVDVLVNNAGVCASGPFSETDIEVWESLMNTNVMGAVYCTRAMLPYLRESTSSNDGSKPTIVNVNSFGGIMPLHSMTAYCTSKYALQGFTDTLRLELKSEGIHVATVHPGIINSNFMERAQFTGQAAIQRRDQMKNVLETLPGVQQPTEIAEAVLQVYGQEKDELVVGAGFNAATTLYRLGGVNPFSVSVPLQS